MDSSLLVTGELSSILIVCEKINIEKKNQQT